MFKRRKYRRLHEFYFALQLLKKMCITFRLLTMVCYRGDKGRAKIYEFVGE